MSTTFDSGSNSSALDADGGLAECGRGYLDSRFAGDEAEDVEDRAAGQREGDEGGLEELEHGYRDARFAGGEAKDRAAEEREDRGLAGFDVPCRPFEPPRNNAERMGLGMGGGNFSSPSRAEERRAGTEDDESLSSQWSEERAVHVAIIVEGGREGAYLEDNSLIGDSHLCNITDSPRELKGIYKRRGSYVANICHRRRTHKVGTYELRTDAALAYDEISRALRGPARGTPNFSAKLDHVRMREEEMESNGLRVDLEETLAMISARVERVISSVRAPEEENDLADEAMLKSTKGSRKRHKRKHGAGGPAKPVESCDTKKRLEHSPAGAEPENDNAALESLKGVHRSHRPSARKSYRSMISHRGKCRHLGCYELRADAAFAYDWAGQALNGAKWSKSNFGTRKDHVDMRQKEMGSTGLDVDLKEALARISMNVKKAVSAVRSGSGRDGDGRIGDDDGSYEECSSAGAELENRREALESPKGARRSSTRKRHRNRRHLGYYCP